MKGRAREIGKEFHAARVDHFCDLSGAGRSHRTRGDPARSGALALERCRLVRTPDRTLGLWSCPACSFDLVGRKRQDKKRFWELESVNLIAGDWCLLGHEADLTDSMIPG